MAQQTKPEVVLDEIREILWPGGDEDHEWDEETLENVARALHEQGYGPKGKENYCETCREKDHDTCGDKDGFVEGCPCCDDTHNRDEAEEEEDDGSCSTCLGTGIGQSGDPDTSRCFDCGGTGQRKAERDPDDYDRDADERDG